jgi:signal peptidase I
MEPITGNARSMKRHRSPLAAAFLNLIFPPLGFVYVGKSAYAWVYVFIIVGLVPVASWTRAFFLPHGVLAFLAIAIGIWIGVVIFAAVLARRQDSVTAPRWYVYVMFIVVGVFLTSVYEVIKLHREEWLGYAMYRIPSGAMVPTILIGDFIVADTTSLSSKTGEGPSRGDVVTFLYPEDPTIPFIKRVVGLPGDHIAYYDKVLYINGDKVEQEILGTYAGAGADARMIGASLRREVIGKLAYNVLVQAGYPSIDGEFVVPEDHYFFLGDNRDNSRDSRYFGTVHRDYLVGKAVLIWMHIDGLEVEGSWPHYKVSRPYVDFSRFGIPVH